MELHKIKLCRFCLKNDLLVSIYSPAFLLRPIEMIEKLNICKIDDSLPKLLCQSCLYRLLDAYNLQELANSSERQLRQYLGTEITIQAETFPFKKNFVDRTSFTSFCDIFQSNEIQAAPRRIEEDTADDMLNDIEIDVSSLTRSEADDTLSEVFVDGGQMNCHYETETRNFEENIIAVDTDFVIESSIKEETVEIEAINLPNVKRKTIQMAEKCLECGKTFRTTGYLALHKRIHTGERPFKCKLCSRRFVQKSNLHLHQRVHSGERRFQCEICACFFTTLSNLKAHGIVHKDARDFKCNTCEKRFKSARDLRRHEPVHNSIKEHKCSLCEKSFSKSSYLSAHMLTIHRNVKKHKCKDCCKIFASKSNLMCHMRIHSGEKPFQCKHCEWKFNQSSALLRHIQKKHSKSKNVEKNGENVIFAKERNEKPAESTDFEFQLPVAHTAAHSSLNSNVNGSIEHLNQTYIPMITVPNYDYNKIGHSYYARTSS